jgi:hypothetical protein
MKFIGQYIQDFIARFRSDVYLENISSGTIASGGSLGLDSNNKVVKASASAAPDADATTKGIVELATTAEVTSGSDSTRAVTPAGLNAGYQGTTSIVAVGSITTGVWRGTAIDQAYLVGQSGTNTGDQTSVSGNAGTATALETARNIAGVAFDGTGDISLNNNAITNGAGYTTNAGDITKITISDGSSTTDIASGDATVQFLTGEGIDVAINSLSGTVKQVTYSAEDASTSNKGVASFSSDNFAASSGAISIKSGGVDLTDEVTGALPVGNGGTGATTLTSNSILTGNGTSAVQAESTLSYDSEILDIGADDNSAAQIRRLRHTDDEGGDFYIRSGDATGTNKAGGDLQIFGGRATGNAAGGAVIIQAGETNASSGTALRGTNVVASFRTDGDTILQGNLIFEGSVPDAHETTFSITNPTADRTITVPDADVDLTKVRSASATLDGVVELATTAEADTGTDTARAVTPAGLKSHVDARFAYQYISFTGSATVPSDGDWMTVSANGISNHTWNTNLGSGGTTVGSSTVTIPTTTICQGIIVPYDCTLVGYTSLIRSVGNHQSKVGLAVGVPTYNDFATYDCTLVAYNAADTSAGPDSNYSQRPVRADYLSANRSMSAGHVIFPLIGSVASNSRTVQWNCTLVLKTLLP